VKAGRREDLVTSLDLPSTILAACGVQPPKTMQGLSLLDVAGGAEKSLPRDAVFGEIFTHDAASLDKPELSMTHRWVRQGDLKLHMGAKFVTAKQLAEEFDLNQPQYSLLAKQVV
jgi:uncharacterized sulfatase